MEFAEAQVHKTGNQLHVTHGDDRALFVEFETEAVHQGAESEKQGRPIYKDVAFIRIMMPGDRTREVYRPVRTDPAKSAPYPPDPDRFPRQWAAFQAKQEQVQEGTPVTEWAPLTKSRALELKALHIHTVEQLAAIPDNTLHSLGMGGRDLRGQAIAWLAQAKDGAATTALAAENQHLKDEMAALKLQFAELAAAQAKKPAKAAPAAEAA